tara:strand:- start:1629 stop:2204 length:576 start_codon:yes stop_codon:yes gene_type:complete
LKEKFRKFLPVVVDIETGGFNPVTDAILEIAITLIDYDKSFSVGKTFRHHIAPFKGLNVSDESLEFTGINLNHPLRNAEEEKEALKSLFDVINKHKNKYECSRAILVGHNAHFDLSFLNESLKRNNIKKSPFHPFSVFDTVSIGGIFTGQTVLARVAQELGFEYENDLAHSAAYDSEITAKVFCKILNEIN